jgi:hypothetical protein
LAIHCFTSSSFKNESSFTFGVTHLNHCIIQHMRKFFVMQQSHPRHDSPRISLCDGKERQ